ncbi:MAG: hypothetical protein LWX07_02655 [Bacteroidetes bacterium]|nr:hypothetical protein [Bacteroidota bacterium]
MPNSAYLHLLLNHFPIIGTAFVIIVAGYGVRSNNDRIKRLGMLMLVLVGLITVPVFISGNKAEGTVKGLDGIQEEYIHPHEDFAKASMIAMEVTAGISLLGLVIFRGQKNVPVWYGILLLLFMIAVNGMMIYTGHLGGKISHLELMNLH